MKNLEKLVGRESPEEFMEVLNDHILSKEDVSELSKMKYSTGFDKSPPDRAYVENKYVKFHVGYNTNEGVYYFSLLIKDKTVLGCHPILDQFKDTEYKTSRKGNKIIIEGKDRKLQINQSKNGDIYSYSAVRSVVLNEFMKFAKYYSEFNLSPDKQA